MDRAERVENRAMNPLERFRVAKRYVQNVVGELKRNGLSQLEQFEVAYTPSVPDTNLHGSDQCSFRPHFLAKFRLESIATDKICNRIV